MSSLSNSTPSKQEGSPDKSKFGSYLASTIYLLAIVGVVAFLYQSVVTTFFGN